MRHSAKKSYPAAGKIFCILENNQKRIYQSKKERKIRQTKINNNQLRILKEKIWKMEQIECKKAYFYAEIGHDLRQPLQAVKLFTSLLKDENLSSNQAELVSKLENSVEYLTFWLDNLLEITRLESGHLKRKDSQVELQSFLTNLAQEYKNIAFYKGIKFLYGGKKIEVKTDRILLERIIRNLLNNALKYGREKIELKWYKLPQKIKIIIKDKGYGLKQEQCRQLFRAFYQCPHNQEQGYGLGLAIVKELTDILNIKIDLKSKWKKGTIFVLSIPQ